MTDFIKEYWEKQGEIYETSHKASWGDKHAINLEIETILKYVNSGDRVLDIGCANGYSTFFYLKQNPKHIIGVDFSENMINNANKSRKELKVESLTKFEVGDIRDLKYSDNLFDVVYTTRVLINLPTWEQQIQGMKEALRVTRKGGVLLISEAFWEPLMILNSIRCILGLPALVEHDFNRYLKKDRLEKLLQDLELPFEVIDYSSIYYFGSRVLRELVTRAEDYPGYSNPINEVFFNIEKAYSGGNMGIQQIYVIKK